MIDDLQIRDVTGIDQAEIIALWEAAGLTRPWNDPHTDFALALQTPTTRILAACQNDKIVGTLMVGFDGHRGWLYYLGISPNKRRCGLATRLITAATDWLHSLGCPKAELMVRADNSEAKKLYEALGWQVEPVSVYAHWLNQERD